MNLNLLHQKLITAARRHAPSDHVPYAFEQRIMARLAATPLPDGLALWAQALWRAAVPCLAIVLLAGIGAFFLPVDKTTATVASTASGAPATELSQEFENTLLAAVDQPATASEDYR